MKRIVLLFFILSIALLHGQITLIPDMDFEQALIDLGIDTDGTLNGQVLTVDISDETTLDVNNEGIFSMEGIQDFTSLEFLNCSGNAFSEIDVSNLVLLKDFYCNENQLTEIDVSNLTQLEHFDCESNLITSIDVSNNTLLESLFIGSKSFDVGWHNNIATIDLSNNINLQLFACDYNFSLSNLNLSSNLQLKFLYAKYCDLDELDLSNNIALEKLFIGAPTEFTFPSNNFTSLDLSANVNLNRLAAARTNISDLNLKNSNNGILTNVELWLNDDLFCIEVDDPVGANNGVSPYDNWDREPQTYFQHNCSLGVKDFNEINISVLPNPASESIAINIQNALIKHVRLYAISGIKVLEKNGGFDAMDVSNLATGMYLLEISTSEGSFTQKIIKE